MKIPVEIETHDRQLAFELFETRSMSSGMIKEIPGNAKIQLRGLLARKAVGVAAILQLVLDTATNVEYGLIAAWLYGRVAKHSTARLIINRRVVTEITPESIRAILEEEISHEK